MNVSGLALLACLMLVCSIGPGFFFVRRLRWTPRETLCASVALSMVLVYLGSIAIYWLDIPAASHWILSVICLVLTLARRRELARLCFTRQVRLMLMGWGFVLVWMFLQLSLIRHYAGGTWSGDWLEHYQRSIFFLAHDDLNYRFLQQYLLTDRPPLMNLVCAHFMAQAGTGFEVYQLTAVFLNLLPVLPCLLFASSISSNRNARRGAVAVLPALLAMNPMFVQNVTYVWTKSFAAFYALLFLWLYVRGWRKRDGSRIVGAFIFAAAGCLVHYSIVPLTIIIAIHYLLIVWPKRKKRWLELGAAVALPMMLLSTWFAWAITQYGIAATFASNLTISNRVTGGAASRWLKIAHNLFATTVPFFLRPVPYADFRQNDPHGFVRDLAFCLYQTNLFFVLGSVGAIVLAYAILTGKLPWPKWPAQLRGFWVIVIPFSIVLGIAAAPVAEAWGVAHLAMQTQALLGIAAIAGIFGAIPKPWRFIVLVGVALDFALGIFLHVHLEHRVFDVLQLPGGFFAPIPTPRSLSHSAEFNLSLKLQWGLGFVGDALANWGLQIQIAVVLLFLVALFVVYRRGLTFGKMKRLNGQDAKMPG